MNPNGQDPTALPRSQVSVKTVLAVTFTVAAVALGIYLVARTPITWSVIVASTLVAVALDHGVAALTRRGWGRPWAILAVLAAVVVVLVAAGLVVLPEAARQIRQLGERLPELVGQMQATWVFQLLDERFGLSQLLVGQVTVPRGAIETSLAALRVVGVWVVILVTSAFTVIFMLGYGGQLVRGALAEATPLHRERYERFIDKVYRSVGGYLSGLAVLALLHALINSIALALFGIPFFLPLGIVSGFGSFVPFVGAFVSGALMGTIGVATGGLWVGLGVVAWYTVYQQIENNLFAPLIFRRTVRINPLVALLAVIFLAELAGVVGALLAVPAAAVAQIVVREILILRRQRLAVPAHLEVAEAIEARDEEDESPRPPQP